MKMSNYEQVWVATLLQARPNLDHVKFILLYLFVYNREFPLVIFPDMPFFLSFGSLLVNKLKSVNN